MAWGEARGLGWLTAILSSLVAEVSHLFPLLGIHTDNWLSGVLKTFHLLGDDVELTVPMGVLGFGNGLAATAQRETCYLEHLTYAVRADFHVLCRKVPAQRASALPTPFLLLAHGVTGRICDQKLL